eukprot:2231827-Rhodomonas_salina.3
MLAHINDTERCALNQKTAREKKRVWRDLPRRVDTGLLEHRPEERNRLLLGAERILVLIPPPLIVAEPLAVPFLADFSRYIPKPAQNPNPNPPQRPITLPDSEGQEGLERAASAHICTAAARTVKPGSWIAVCIRTCAPHTHTNRRQQRLRDPPKTKAARVRGKTQELTEEGRGGEEEEKQRQTSLAFGFRLWACGFRV